jgi:hypothetical protein
MRAMAKRAIRYFRNFRLEIGGSRGKNARFDSLPEYLLAQTRRLEAE